MPAPDRPTPRARPRERPTFRAADGRKLGLLGLVVMALLVGVGASEGAPAPLRTSTPEGAFNAFKKAAADRDFKAMAAHMTPELLGKLTEPVIQSGIIVAGILDKIPLEARKGLQPMMDALAKHGLSEGDLKNAKGNKDAPKALAARVKDKAGLIVDLVEAMNRNSRLDEQTRARDKEEREATLAARLVGVRVTGDTATATLLAKKRDRNTGRMVQKVGPVRFKFVGGTWRISEIPLD